MYEVSCILLKSEYVEDEIGQQSEIITETEVPIIKTKPIYSKEFYEANEQGIKPTLKLVISNLNYDGEKELKYGGVTYTIIRMQNPYLDELELICERKVKNISNE